ncbi:type II toxin-antitoxin system HicB family antitoxin [Eubacterium sp. An11]|uniref:type II toxin-antitoxin system HicB family antitoxin n=1 Tax=Eubacterium sp. An11 TaxID=1965542 RepID=UPI001FA92AFF|nr:type II toxin-antitoxin system HicB family antitoxin [Eubacterium sp. An11]
MKEEGKIVKENYIYPVVLHKEEDGYLITFPDFPDQMTEAENEEEAVKAAQEVLALCISQNEDMGKENPKAKSQEEIKIDENSKLVYVHLWMPYFRKIEKVVYVKKTLTIPKWLDEMAKEKKINFSAVLVKGLKRELGIVEK